MSDKKSEGGDTSSCGNEWEVVSLTASAYAAAPGSNEFVPTDANNDKELTGDQQAPSSAMFMSKHFMFPSGQLENLPIKPECIDICDESADQGKYFCKESQVDLEDIIGCGKAEQQGWDIKGISEIEEVHGIHFFNKGKSISMRGIDFEESKTFQGLNLVLEEQSIYGGAGYDSIHSEEHISGTDRYDEDTIVSESDQLNIDAYSDTSKSPKLGKDNKCNGCGIPCEAWWKRRASFLYAHAKEANTFWSVCIAAALMGLVVLGQRWRQEHWQIQQLKWHFSISDEMLHRIFPRFKEALAGSHHHRVPLIRTAPGTF